MSPLFISLVGLLIPRARRASRRCKTAAAASPVRRRHSTIRTTSRQTAYDPPSGARLRPGLRRIVGARVGCRYGLFAMMSSLMAFLVLDRSNGSHHPLPRTILVCRERRGQKRLGNLIHGFYSDGFCSSCF